MKGKIINYVLLGVLSFLLVNCVAKQKKTEEKAYAEEVLGNESKNVKTKAGVQSLSAAEHVADRVFFDFNSSSLESDAKDVLKVQAQYITKNNLKVVIEGHCDERGTKEYNLALGNKRGNAAKEFLVANGVNVKFIKVVSYGKEKPAIAESTEEGWAANRRAVTIIKLATKIKK